MAERFVAAWSLERPVLPAPHQIVAALWASTVEMPVSSPRSLVFHGWVTLSSTLLGFALGAVLGMVLAIGIVHVRTLERSLMPWLIASQTIPILAIAPIVVVALGAVGITGLVPKALISMYLSFFPVAIGMVKGLTSPDPMLLDLIRTYSAGRLQTLLRLRLPAALPYLFASLKIAVAISLVGAIVGELPTGSSLGLGARLLVGLLLRPDHPDLGRAVRGRDPGGLPRPGGGAGGAPDRPGHGSAAMSAVAAAVLAVAFAALIGWAHARPGAVPAVFWIATLAAWAGAWWLNHRLAGSMPKRARERPARHPVAAAVRARRVRPVGDRLRRRRHSVRAAAAALGDPRQARHLGRDPAPGFRPDRPEVGAAGLGHRRRSRGSRWR